MHSDLVEIEHGSFDVIYTERGSNGREFVGIEILIGILNNRLKNHQFIKIKQGTLINFEFVRDLSRVAISRYPHEIERHT